MSLYGGYIGFRDTSSIKGESTGWWFMRDRGIYGNTELI